MEAVARLNNTSKKRVELMKRAVFLDRDGVINRVVWRNGRPDAPWSVEELELLPEAKEAIAALRQAGFCIIVITNQPDVGKGLLRREAVEAMHARLRQALPIDDIRVCYHTDEDGCPCRKPKPGMLLEAARAWDVSLGHSVMIGDRWRDIDAGKAAGCKTILVRSAFTKPPIGSPDVVVTSLLEASRVILSQWNAATPRCLL